MNGWTPSTTEPAVASVVDSIREAIVAVTGPSLVGLYLFGSLASGDFEVEVSDIDLLAVLDGDPGERLVPRLRRMHADLARAHPAWDDRIEVIYISAHGLAACRTDTTTIAVISSGEPFHVVEAGQDWTLTWYPAREDGVRLAGPPIDSLIPPIPRAEFLGQVRRSLAGFADRIPDDAPPGWQAYAILTTCRALYATTTGERVSKQTAAAWAQRELPQWSDLVGRALVWRQRQRDPGWQDGAATVSETRSFVAEMEKLASSVPPLPYDDPAVDHGGGLPSTRGTGMDWKLELVVVPVTDVEGAKHFYSDQVGFAVDHDTRISDEVHVVQLTPPGSDCSIAVATGMVKTPPGSVEGLQLVVPDIEAARTQLAERGVEVSQVQHYEGANLVDGPGGRWNSFIFFSDPDGNRWAVQERPATQE
jgi:catechol 2,3-dioxygenase-like lactoylglutathione lyase family enzyme